MLEYLTLVSGERVGSSDWLELTNPFTGRAVGRVALASRDITLRALERTRAARVRLTRHERYEILNRMAERVQQNRESIACIITDESGLCLKDTLYEADRVVDVLHFSAIKALDDDSEVFPCDVSRHGKPRRIYSMRVPLKLVGAITPFNHPMNQVVHKLAPAIATGNKVVLKPSEKTPLSAHYLAQVALDCGLSPEMLSVLTGSVEEVAEPLVRSELVELIFFTGSSRVGKQIAASAGYKRLVLELGGSSALLVLEDADPAEAAEIALTGIFRNSGQRCTAIRRLLVHESLARPFVEVLVERVSRLKWGDPYDPENDVGTVIDEAAAAKIEARVSDALARGARLLYGHRREGALYAPTVLDLVQNHDPLVASETFGPVAPIIRFRTLDEAIRLANDTPYGLSGGVVSNHWPSIQRVITELDTGTVNVNEAPSYRLEWSPFGGVKDSGLGYKEGVIEAMKAMTVIKTYSLPWSEP